MQGVDQFSEAGLCEASSGIVLPPLISPVSLQKLAALPRGDRNHQKPVVLSNEIYLKRGPEGQRASKFSKFSDLLTLPPKKNSL